MPKLDLTRAARIKGPGGEILRLRGAGFTWTRQLALTDSWSITAADAQADIMGFPTLFGTWSIAAGDAQADIISFPKV